MKVIEALQNALAFLESLGHPYNHGDVHDDLDLAISRLCRKCPQVMQEEL
jgi:hypothetical protein